ncbi:MAG: hypothetical protein C5B55_11150 [Blastocatellia bacterium]|nr:MAG: hypothetical protein C5B55_11150 [Blastocatellia bacterium]
MFEWRRLAPPASRHLARRLACEQRASVRPLIRWQRPGTKFRAVATDYDGTLASDGMVQPETLRALSRVRLSNRKMVLVTGREITSLKEVLSQLELFDLIVAENGAVLYSPSSRTEVPLAKAPVPAFVKRLQEEGVQPLSVGTAVVATLRVHETTVLRLIRELDLDLQASMNRESMMILPSGVNKVTGQNQESAQKPREVSDSCLTLFNDTRLHINFK